MWGRRPGKAVVLLLVLSLPPTTRAWHASLGKRAAPIVHATTQRGDLELPRAQDVIDNPCLTVTVSVEKLHLICNTTCATAMPCDWNCQAAWNSFLRDAHSLEDQECASYADFLDQTPLKHMFVPALPGTGRLSRPYLFSLIASCKTSCPGKTSIDDPSYPCGAAFDLERGSSFHKCLEERDPSLPSCFPLAPLEARCTGGDSVFNVTDGTLWFPFVTWSALAYYKQNRLGDSGGLYATKLGLEGNEYSSWGCLWEETCKEMKQRSRMACFRYSHVRGEFIFWKWSHTSNELKNTILDVWTVDAKFCDASNRPTYVDARNRSKVIHATDVKYVFNRMHQDGVVRPAISGLMSELGDNGCGVFHLQRDLQYLLEIRPGVDDYFVDSAFWCSPTKVEMLELPASKIEIPITIPLFPKKDLECSSLALTLSWCGTSAIDLDLVLFKVKES